MILAVLLTVGAAQKHIQPQHDRTPAWRKEGRSSLSGFPETGIANTSLTAAATGKSSPSCESQANLIVNDVGASLKFYEEVLMVAAPEIPVVIATIDTDVIANHRKAQDYNLFMTGKKNTNAKVARKISMPRLTKRSAPLRGAR